MRTLISNFALLTAATLMTGCLRAIQYTSAPSASGRVMDSVDHHPVPDATVTLIPEEIGSLSDHNVTKKVQTSRQGIFRIPQQKDWIVYEAGSPALHRGWCASAVLRIQHAGYETFETNIASGPFQIGPEIDDFKAGDICLQNLSAK
jgi:hypothetical protein